MQLTKGQYTADIPLFSFIDKVIVEYTSLSQLTMHDFMSMKIKAEINNKGVPVYGRPVYFTIGMYGELLVWPIPDRDYTVRFRYAPPLLEY